MPRYLVTELYARQRLIHAESAQQAREKSEALADLAPLASLVSVGVTAHEVPSGDRVWESDTERTHSLD